MRKYLLLYAIACCFTANAGVRWQAHAEGDSSPLPATHDAPVTYTVSCADSGTGAIAEIQAAVNDSWRGDTILLNAKSATGNQCRWSGTTNVSSAAAAVLIRVRPEREGETGRLRITTSEYAKLPNVGTRITPAYAPLMPVLSLDGNAGFFELAGVTPPASHVQIDGLLFTVGGATQTSAPGAVHNYSAIITGNNQSGAWYPVGPYATRLAVASAAGDSTFYVESTNGLYAGLEFMLQNTSWNAAETGIDRSLTIASVGVDCVTTPNCFTTTAPAAKSHIVNAWILPNLNSGGAEMQPDDIIIRHCIFTQDHLHRITRWITLSSRTTLIEDNFAEGVMDVNSASDTQVIWSTNGLGPFLIRNNYLAGSSETIMYGGAGPGYDKQPDYSLIQFNWLGHIPERERVSPWSHTQDPNRGTWNGSGPYGGRMVFKGRGVHPTDSTKFSQLGYFQAQNTGVVCDTEPDWGTTATTPIGAIVYENCGTAPWGVVAWKRIGAGSRHMMKNTFELKTGRNITLQHNVFDWMHDAVPYNATQPHMLVIKANNMAEKYTRGTNYPNGSPTGGCTCHVLTSSIGCNYLYSDGPVRGWPDCYRARTSNIKVMNNIFRSYAGGMAMQGGQWSDVEYVGDYLIKDNLWIQTEDPVRPSPQQYTLVSLAGSYGPGGNTTAPIPGGIQILNNTFFSPFQHNSFTWLIEGRAGLFPGPNAVAGNIWYRGTGGYRGGGVDGAGTIQDVFPGLAGWGKNIIVGAPIEGSYPSGYPSGTVLNLCPGNAACTTNWDFDHPLYGRVFRNPNAGLFAVRETHAWAKRALPDGFDIGADVNQLPEINDLRVIPTDRTVLFQWSLTSPILHIPCVVEVNDSPDFAGNYVGELSQISTYYRQDADDYARYARHGNTRMITIGHTVPLNASTTYYYRLHCGGDSRRGEFTTDAGGEGTAQQTISRVLTHPSATMMDVEYGTSYSRETGVISDGGMAPATCDDGNSCSASFPAIKGTVVYYRWMEREASGTTLRMGEVSTLAAR